MNAGAGERKSRREREREKEAAAGAAGGVVAPAGGVKPPTSPKRDRGPRQNKDAVNASGLGPAVKVPGILQRADVPPLAIARGEAPRVGESGVLVPPPDGGGRGGKRGRGRGRGGNPGPPIRGG